MAAMMEQFSERARAAGATFQTFSTLDAMAAAIAERTYGNVVIVADSSIVPGPTDVKKISEARGKRKDTVPMLLMNYAK